MPMQTGQLGNAFPYDPAAAQTWNASAQAMNGGPGLLGSNGAFGPSRSVKASRGRPAIPEWYDQPRMSHGFSPMDEQRNGGMQHRHNGMDADDELIPTAIVIKNIPFAVKKEQLTEVMTNMNLPLPYAFNYHFDNGVFRGLAFANFTSPDETARVIQALNHMDLSGRKLRVEYKKMLPLAERERIEREKRERRGQLEEQHRPMQGSSLHGQISISSLASHQHPDTSPSPISMRAGKPDVDMNDPQTLEFYTQLRLFRDDPDREAFIFPPTLGPTERRIVHTLAHNLGLGHASHGNGDQRQVHIYRAGPAGKPSPTNNSMSGAFQGHDSLRRNLSRAATTDFNETRQNDQAILRGQSSVGLLSAIDTHAFGTNANLRAAKSYADLRSWSPSPVPSTASFPSAFQGNGSRLQPFEEATGADTPTLMASVSNPGINLPRDENFLISGMNGLGLGNGASNQTSPRRQRSMFSSWEDSQSYPATAPIGSNRNVSTNGEAVRQPRGPTSDRGQGFGQRRQNGRGSDELRTGPPIIVE